MVDMCHMVFQIGCIAELQEVNEASGGPANSAETIVVILLAVLGTLIMAAVVFIVALWILKKIRTFTVYKGKHTGNGIGKH